MDATRFKRLCGFLHGAVANAAIDKLPYTRARELAPRLGSRPSWTSCSTCATRYGCVWIPFQRQFDAYMTSNGRRQPAKGAKAAIAAHHRAIQAVWAVLDDRTSIETGATVASITGSGKVASPLGHTKRHVRNLINALNNAKECAVGKMLKGAIASHTAPEVHDHVARRHRSCVKGVDDLKLPGSVPQHRALNALSQTCRAARAAPQAKRLGAWPGANRPCPASTRRWAWWLDWSRRWRERPFRPAASHQPQCRSWRRITSHTSP